MTGKRPSNPDDVTHADAPGVDTQLALDRARQALLGRTRDQPLTVGRYRITRPLGAGGMSVVYVAEDDELDREVAIKLLRSGFARTQGWRERLRREALAMARLSHVNVAHVYEVGEHDGQDFIAMELVRGEDLRRWARAQPRSVPEILAMYLQAARGLAAAHDAGLVHRDFKPENVLVDENGWARVLDFGLVVTDSERLIARSRQGGDARASIDITSAGTVIGTPAYMAPEQLAGRNVDARADQFAFCICLYEVLYGARPFPGQSVEELAASMQTQDIPAPGPNAAPHVPERVHAVIERGLSRDPDDRFATMDELVEALVTAQQHRERVKLVELERRAHQLDFTSRAQVRWQHALAIGLVLAGIVGSLYALRKLQIYEIDYGGAIAFGVLLFGLQLHSERRIRRNATNEIDRRWARMLTLGSPIVVLSLAFSWLAGFALTTGIAVAFFTTGAIACVMTLLVDARAVVSGLLMMLTAVALVLAPDLRTLWVALGLVASFGSLAWAWRQRGPPDVA